MHYYLMASRIVDREFDAKKADHGLKNQWKWEWLEKKVKGELVSQHIRKINSRGVAFCNVCQKDINYSTRGWRALEQHLQKKLHIDNKRIKASNQCLSG